MIKIENLKKIYRSNAKDKCTALDKINLTLPDKGMVFILGKSGSGKSTLLNLIGGLDSFDEGDIITWGHSLASFSERDYEAYRSDAVSFIFQDYHLIEELTVLDNILLFTSENHDEDLLMNTLEVVGMKDYVDRYPRELSGGQRQRVAIARGIIKNPDVILCDEPTGNLDRKTSLQILQLLKKLSTEKLVLIVSHNLSEAELFADRIIELSYGKIVDDITKENGYTDDFSLIDGVVNLPYHRKMTDDELNSVNNAIGDRKISRINQNTSGFSPTKIKYKSTKKSFVANGLIKKSIVSLFKRFFFANKRSSIATIVFSALLFSVFAIVQSFTMFDAANTLKDFVNNTNSTMVIERDHDGFPYAIHDDISALSGERIYKFYPQTIYQDTEYGNSFVGNLISDEKNFSDLYIHESYGLLLCDREYLTELYGNGGDLTLLAGNLEDATTKSGVLITDYFADSIIYHEVKGGSYRHTDYESIIGIYSASGFMPGANICGIIDTDYMEKYGDAIERFGELDPEDIDFKDLISTDEIYATFIDDVKTNLGIAYSLNPNYIDSFSIDEVAPVRTKGIYLSAEGKSTNNIPSNYISKQRMLPLSTSDFAENEIAIPYAVYNSLFGTKYTKDDTYKLGILEPKTVKLTRYVDDNPKLPVVYEKEFTVTCLSDSYMCMSEENLYFIKKSDWIPTRLYIKDPADVSAITDFVTENHYHLMSREQQNIQQINVVISSFKQLFTMLEWVLVAMIIGYLVMYGIKSIKQNSYQIGVIKALGGKNSDVGKVFIAKTFIIGFASSIISFLLAIALINVSDATLISSLEATTGVRFNDVSIIRLFPSILVLDSLAMIFISFISSLAPVIVLKRIKPIEIIKAKE